MAQTPKKHKYQGPGAWGNPDNFRLKLFEACGLTEERQASLMNGALAQLEKDLTATKTLAVVVGTDVRTLPVEDNIARGKARDQVFKLIGANAPNTALTHTVTTRIQVDWPAFMRPEPQAVVEVASVTPQAIVDQTNVEQTLDNVGQADVEPASDTALNER